MPSAVVAASPDLAKVSSGGVLSSYLVLTFVALVGMTRIEKTRLSSKGQVVLPKSVRKDRNWGPGTEFVVEQVNDGVLLRPVKAVQTGSVKELLGCTGYQGPARSLGQMQEAIARGVKDRHARGRH